MNLSDIASKKVAGVPVLYLAGGAVAILAVVAWRMKPAPEVADTVPTEDALLDENGIADGSNPYAGMATNGTVVVQPAAPSNESPAVPDRPGTNDEWVREGSLWLNANKNVTPTAAYAALTKFIKGQSRSSTEAGWIESVITHQGFPPESYADAPLPTSPQPPSTGVVVLAPPKGLKAVWVKNTSVGLQWDNVPGAIGYQVFLSGKQWGRTVIGSDYVITGLRPNTHYNVGAAAVFPGSPGWKVSPVTTILITTKK